VLHVRRAERARRYRVGRGRRFGSDWAEVKIHNREVSAMSVAVSVKRTAKRVTYLAVAAALFSLPSVASAQDFVPVTAVSIGPNVLSSFDISWDNPEVHAYFLSDRSNQAVDVIDTVTKSQSKLLPGQFAGSVATADCGGVANGCNGPNGVHSFNNNGRVEVWADDGPCTGPGRDGACTASCPYYAEPAQFIPGTTDLPTGPVPTQYNNTNCSTVKVIDYATGSLIANIPTGGGFRADETCYDPVDHLVEVANDSEQPWPWINYISTDTYKVVARILVVGATNGLEQCKWNARNGLIYANVPEINGDGNDDVDGNTYVIDPRVFPPRVVNKFDIPVGQCAGPQGMAIGPAPQIMLGCNAEGPPEVPTGCSLTLPTTTNAPATEPTNPCAGSGPQNTAVLDENTGRLIKVLPNQGGNDEVWFNPGDGLYFLAQGSHLTEQYLGIVSSEPIRVIQDISIDVPNCTSLFTTCKPHSVAADPIQNEVYLPIEGGVSTICGMFPPATNAQGCVAVFKSNAPRPHVVYGR
jgi:hypothetical protein